MSDATIRNLNTFLDHSDTTFSAEAIKNFNQFLNNTSTSTTPLDLSKPIKVQSTFTGMFNANALRRAFGFGKRPVMNGPSANIKGGIIDEIGTFTPEQWAAIPPKTPPRDDGLAPGQMKDEDLW